MTGKRWLIIGGSGYVGMHLRRRLGDTALATFNHAPFAGGVPFDGRKDRLSQGLLQGEPSLEAAFILQGISNIDACFRDPSGSRSVNVDAIIQVVEDLTAAGIVPVFTSSDAVLDGTGSMVDESEPARPLMTYGRQKAEIELYLASLSTRSIVVRLSKVVGTDRHRSNILSNWLDEIERGNTIKCANDHVFSPILADDAAEALVRLVDAGAEGLYNLAGPEPITRRRLLDTLTNRISNYRNLPVVIQACRLNDLGFFEPRPINQSMDIRKLVKTIRWSPTTMDNVCQILTSNCYGTN